MSHLATVTTKCTDLDLFIEVLEELGFKMEKKESTVKDMVGKTAKVLAKCKNQPIGVQEVVDKAGNKTYELRGEFWNTKWYNNPKELSKKINQEYSFKAVCKENVSKGYRLKPGSLKVAKDGSRVFVFQKM